MGRIAMVSKINKGIILIISYLFIANKVLAANYYVATTGSNSNDGLSVNKPFANIVYAVSKVVAGDIIYVRGGTYTSSSTISISKSGTSDALIKILVYPGDERPVLDFSGMAISGSNRGIVLSGSYWYIKGLKIKGAGDNGLNMSGAYNTIEFCDFFENRDGGCQLGGGAHDNKIINCDSYYNADYVSGSTSYTGGNADGFSPKLDVGTNNYFYGCRAWLNSDDGFDGYLRPADGITTTLENCWVWSNGYLKDGVTTTSSMNGNGFKMGGSDTKDLRHNFIVKNCLSFSNKANGFDQNSNVGSITLYNCTALKNGKKNYYLNSSVTLPSGSVFTVTNCVDVITSSTSFRTGTILTTNKFGATNTDFVSVDTTGISGLRKPDGSLPDLTFMHLQTNPQSTLIDAGTDVGLPYQGSKPDLGCFESGIVLYTLSATVGVGKGVVTPSGSNKYSANTKISVTAVPDAGYTFDNWMLGSAVLGTDPVLNITMDADKSIVANFKVSTGFKTVDQETGVSITMDDSGKLWLRLCGDAKVGLTFYDIQGRVVNEINPFVYASGLQEIMLKGRMVPGIYLCKISMNNKVYIQKIIIQ